MATDSPAFLVYGHNLFYGVFCMSEHRTKMLAVRVSEAEHAALLDRCNRPRLAEWMRSVCLGEPVARKHRRPPPMIDPALLRQLAGLGNNLNQIARQVNTATVAGGALPAVQICAALAAIERELRRLREAYSHDC
jgi:hypothetical protein